MANTIKVDRGALFEILLAAEAVLDDRAAEYLATTPQDRLEGARTAAEEIRDELLG